MKISVKAWVIFILIAILGFYLWMHFGYPSFSFVDLSVNKKEALNIAVSYLDSLGVGSEGYSHVITFENDGWADRYLQKTLGSKKENEFVTRYNYELFFWKVRFFKQSQKEEYLIEVSPKSKEILSFAHPIEDIVERKSEDQEIAKRKARRFLEEKFAINIDEYDFHEVKITRLEKRTDYSFSWEHKDVYIPWQEDEGGAKLLIGATVSGNEIRRFYKNYLDIPEKFSRYVEKQLVFGEYLLSFYFLILTFLIASSIYLLIKKRNQVVTRFCKKWYLYLAIVLVFLSLVSFFNNLENIIMHYSTSVSLASYIGINLVKVIINLAFFNVAFVMIGVAGETLRNEVMPKRQESSFLHYLRSTFFSRRVSGAILLGYLLFVIMLGLQAFIFDLGQEHLGVWKEHFRFTRFSSAYVPFLGAFIIGITASVNEEVIFRIFAINWGKKYFKNIFFAIFFSALIWGFGHTGYAIFPVWFRGIEISIIGLMYGVIFIKYGIIPLIVAHYLFDVFWGIAAYILTGSSGYLFGGSIFVFLIPLILALVAYFLNQEEREKPIKNILDNIQRYNLGVLKTFVSERKSKGLGEAAIKKELLAHNWDIDLVEIAIHEVF
ncbi:MAG: CPBP family intramembrane glutamic endopeptidase [Candidatus Omnitrophota bacterium]